MGGKEIMDVCENLCDKNKVRIKDRKSESMVK
jgi:hypothetical protein